MRKLIWSGVVLCGLLGGCASTPEKPEEPAVAQSEPPVANPEFAPGESPKNTTSQEGKAPVQAIAVDANAQPGDPLTIEGFRAFRDVLDVTVRHGGGCREHTYGLAWNGEFQQGTDGTPVAHLVITHDAKQDMCKALVMATPRFDLTSIVERFREKYGKSTGAVDLALPGQPTVRYEF
ncbi:hypothetical protein HPC49_21525 [Pyxidicoccus fallax]|uniref:Lipoprotein n=1 Tax=Pyxidicoccus fallax TaxID=394095 RepID=A0A848L437_9BACT|nr:hypothetical protein [Pyxidicoccus fallax]NMO13720.1 hypothetical protein [Pyxidicoccus fallax]NPC80793.1 hypothetical protein [Pyxidicoccus fallax]